MVPVARGSVRPGLGEPRTGGHAFSSSQEGAPAEVAGKGVWLPPSPPPPAALRRTIKLVSPRWAKGAETKFSRLLAWFLLWVGGACLGLAQATDWPSLIQAAKPAVVWIQVETRQGTAFGSGALVSPDGYILTAAHVIEDAIRITVIVEEQREYRASLVSVDHKADVAVLKIPCLESCRGWGASSRAHANPSPPIPRLRWSFEKGSPLAVAGRET